MIKEAPIRASSMDQLFACAPSILDFSGTRIKQIDGSVRVGLAVHDAAQSLVDLGTYDLGSISAKHGLDQIECEESASIMPYVLRAWEELAPHFQHPKTEQQIHAAIGNWPMKGTMDVASLNNKKAAVFLDWKTGRMDAHNAQQMNCYAFMLWQNALKSAPDCEITGVVVYLRHKYYRVLKWTNADLTAWKLDLMGNVLGGGQATYHPGSHCRFCELKHSCKARSAALGESLESDGQYGDPDQISKSYARMIQHEAKAKEMRAAIKEAVQDLGGSIDTDSGTVLEIQERQLKHLDPAIALPVLQNLLSEQEIAAASKLSYPKLLRAYTKRHENDRTAARNHLHERLSQAGALSERTSLVLNERAPKTGDLHNGISAGKNSHDDGAAKGDSGGD